MNTRDSRMIQYCELCDEPTGRCEDDTIRLPSDTIVCGDCWERSLQGWPSSPDKLERFDLVKASSGDYHHDHVMEPCKTGEWIRWEDAAELVLLLKKSALLISEYERRRMRLQNNWPNMKAVADWQAATKKEVGDERY